MAASGPAPMITVEKLRIVLDASQNNSVPTPDQYQEVNNAVGNTISVNATTVVLRLRFYNVDKPQTLWLERSLVGQIQDLFPNSIFLVEMEMRTQAEDVVFRAVVSGRFSLAQELVNALARYSSAADLPAKRAMQRMMWFLVEDGTATVGNPWM